MCYQFRGTNGESQYLDSRAKNSEENLIRAKKKRFWKILKGSWQQQEFIHRREPEGLATDEGKEIRVSVRGSETGKGENCEGGED